MIHSTATGVPPGGTTVEPTPNEFLFAGEQFDSDLNLYYNRARYLNVSAGRFWTTDEYEGALLEPLSLHKYLYATGDPVNRTDSSGNFGEDITIGMAIQATLAAINVASLLGNTIVSVKSTISAYSYFQEDDPWNGTMAIGNAALHLGWQR